MDFNDSGEWEITQKPGSILPGEVHLWRIRLDGVGDDDRLFWDSLSHEEQDRANRYHFDQHRFRFLRSHGILRRLLAGYTGESAPSIQFIISDLGKPEIVAGGQKPIRFNMSHSGDLMVVGITCFDQIGVDVELISLQLDWWQIAKNFFHPRELEIIESLPDERQRLARFYQIWVIKEAYLKANGKGISGGLDKVMVNFSGSQQAQALAVLSGGDPEIKRWQVLIFKPATAALGALVIENLARVETRVRQFNWQGPAQPI